VRGTQDLPAIAMVLIATLLRSTGGLFMMNLTLQAVPILFWRGTFAALVLLAFAILFERPSIRSIFRISWRAVLLPVISAAAMVAYIGAQKYTSASNVAFIGATLPLVVTALTAFRMREPLTIQAVFSSILIMLGASVILWGSASSSASTLLGDGLAFATTMAMAVVTTELSVFRQGSVLSLAIASNLLVVAIAACLSESLVTSVDQMVVLAGFGLVHMALALVLFSRGAQTLPPRLTAFITTIEAPCTIFWVLVMFDTLPPTPTMVGGAIILITTLHAIVSHKKIIKGANGKEGGAMK
jgi:drug/metabolite transporter (DMT)-like permease